MFSTAKILVSALIPILLAASAIIFVSTNQVRNLSEEEMMTFEQNLLASRQREIKNYMELAFNAIKPLQEDKSLDPATRQRAIKKLINGLNYDDNGYFFIYTKQGVNLAHPTLPNLVGSNSFVQQDANGTYVVRALIDAANRGGDFVRFYWHHPETNTEREKLSYATTLPKLDWVIGTGVYIDDIREEMHKVQLEVKENVKNTFFTVISILGLTIWAIIIMFSLLNIRDSRRAHAELQEKTKQFIEFQANERKRFSRELHDGVNQLLVAAKYRINIAVGKYENEEKLNLELDKAKSTLDEAIHEVRHLSHELRPRLLDDMGLEAALQNLSSNFSEYTDIDVVESFDLEGEKMPGHLEIITYRIVQEALNNIQKHADATRVNLKLRLQHKAAFLEIKDNGKGFEPEKLERHKVGIGIRNIQERVELIGGQFRIESKPRQGARLQVLLPLDNIK